MSAGSIEVPNVLIVEDEMMLRMRAVDIVEDAGFHSVEAVNADGAVAELVGNEVGVVSGVINLESSGVEASDWRLRHDKHYHEARFLAA